jgi:hypothetical protein
VFVSGIILPQTSTVPTLALEDTPVNVIVAFPDTVTEPTPTVAANEGTGRLAEVFCVTAPPEPVALTPVVVILASPDTVTEPPEPVPSRPVGCTSMPVPTLTVTDPLDPAPSTPETIAAVPPPTATTTPPTDATADKPVEFKLWSVTKDTVPTPPVPATPVTFDLVIIKMSANGAAANGLNPSIR